MCRPAEQLTAARPTDWKIEEYRGVTAMPVVRRATKSG